MEAQKEQIWLSAESERERVRVKLAGEIDEAKALRENPELRELAALAEMAKSGARFVIGLPLASQGEEALYCPAMRATNALATLPLVCWMGACGSSPAAQDPDGSSETPDTDAVEADAHSRDAPAPRDLGAPLRDQGSEERGEGVERSVRVVSGRTDDAELIRLLPIGTSVNNAPRRVVLRLDPSDLPSLRRDDVLMTPTEVQVTIACDIGQSGPACGYSPQVAAQLILTGDRDDRDPGGNESRALSEVMITSVTSAEHHQTLAFRASAARATLAGGFALPCIASGRCHVNLVMWAWDSRARPGGADALLIGENEGNYLQNGVVHGDKARLMAVREREIRGADRDVRETSGGGAITMPLDAREVLISSHPLAGESGALAAGEQFYVEARVVAATTGRARFSTQLFLSRDPRATNPNTLNGITPGSISEHNGGNCTPGTSPCATHRVAVFRVTENIRGPVYLQLIARSAVPGGGGGAVVTVDRRDAWVRSTRYSASLF